MLNALRRLFRGNSAAAAVAACAPHVGADVNALLAQPMAALQEGRRDEALAMLETLTSLHPESADAHLLLGTVLHEQRRFEDARDSYLLAACFRPDWWPPHLQQGLLALDEGRHGEAAESLRKAVELGASDARVHNALGAAYLNMGNAHGALEHFRKAVALEPEFAAAHSNLGYVLLNELEMYEEGAHHIERALKIAPEDPGALTNWIMVLYRRGDTEGVVRLADELLARDPKLVGPRVNRALMLLKLGDFERGWPDYEARKQLARSACVNDAPWPEWDGTALGARSVFVYGEQGLGDEIMFASCIPDLAVCAAACTLECHPKLARIFSRSFENVQVLETDTWRVAPSLIRRPPDVKVAIGSLPRFFRRSRADFPSHSGYLRADAERVSHWKAKLAVLPGRRKVGISWRGGLASSRRSLRSIPLEEWLPLLQVAQVDFISLQYSHAGAELEQLRERSGIRVHHWQEAIDDYDETAALVCALDLTVSVQTSVVHLAGALGREVWTLIPEVAEWRYGAGGSSMPWYPSVKLLRQSGGSGWPPVLEQVRDDLAAWVATGIVT